MEKKSSKKKDDLRAGRVVVNLDREEFEFIDKIGRDTVFSTGKRLTNNKIITTIINAIKEININGIGLHNCDELKNRLLIALGLNRERRAYPRFRKEVKVSWRRLESLDEYQSKETTDISQGGFRVVISASSVIPAEPVPRSLGEEGAGIHNPGEVLEFTIIDPKMPDEPIKAIGRIVWVKTQKDVESREAGIRLTYLSEKDKERFDNLFCEGLKNEEAKFFGGGLK